MRRRFAWLLLPLAIVCTVAGLFGTGLYRDRYPDAEVLRLAEVLELRPGSTVAEIGAGEGRMTVRIARYVTSEGHLYATELDGAAVEGLREIAASAGWSNLTVIKGGEADTNLPIECCDAIFLSKVYHHFTHPEEMNRSIYRALRPGGRLAVIDFEPRAWRFWLSRPPGVPENRGGQDMPLEVLREELAEAGFTVEHSIDRWWSWPEQRYCLAARKPGNGLAIDTSWPLSSVSERTRPTTSRTR